MTIECQEEGCTNTAVWVFRGGFSLCNKHYWQDKCSCRAGFDNPKCSIHGREVSLEQGIDPDKVEVN